MINIGTLIANLKLRDQLTPALAKAQQSLKNAGPKMKAVGRSMTTGLTLPILAAGAAAIKFAVDMNKSMANVATLIPGSTERVEELKKSVQDLAIETGKSTADLADGLYQVVSAFGDSADTAKILELNAKAAAAGLATTSDAIALTSAVTKGYGDTSFEAMQKASDLAFTTVKLGQTSFPELAGAIGRVAISASGLKITQEELNTVFATMTGVTGNAAEVSTQFRGAMTGLKKPSEDMKVALKGIGFETGEAALASLGFQGTLKSLMTQTGGNAAEMAKLFESTESWDLIQGIASVNADKFTSNLEAMEGAVGATDEAFKEQTEGVNAAGHAWNQLKSSFTVLLQQLGDELIPTFSKVVASIASSVKWFSALSPTVKKVIIVVAGLAAAIGPVLMVLGFMATGIAGLTAVMGPVLTVLGFMATALAAVSLPVVAVVAGIGLAVAALFAWRKEITAFIKKGINKFMESLDAWKVLLGKMTKAEAAAAKAQRELEADVEDFVPVIEEVTEVLEYQPASFRTWPIPSKRVSRRISGVGKLSRTRRPSLGWPPSTS
jgi:TP901 family phage tail tape measure protein